MKAMLNISTPRRLASLALLVPVIAGALAGCGGASQGVFPTPAPTAAGHVAPCHVGDLQILVDPSAARPRAQGGTYLPINFVNHSGKNCKIGGYPHVVGMSTTGKHNAVASHLRVQGLGGSLLLAPDYTAHAWLLVSDSPSGKTAGCRAFSATGLRVSPPGLVGFAWVNWPLQVCPPPKDAVLSVQAVQPGMASAATFP